MDSLNELGHNAKCMIIKNSGHHLYLDNVNDFHSTINKWLEELQI